MQKRWLAHNTSVFWLPTPQAALDRVARRVRAGGHDVPTDIVVRRYWAGLENMRRLYLPLAEIAAIYDNSDAGRTLVAETMPESGFVVRHRAIWEAMERAKP